MAKNEAPLPACSWARAACELNQVSEVIKREDFNNFVLYDLGVDMIRKCPLTLLLFTGKA
jgi:hypothetical protein